jgi:hypothetical protein
MIYRFHIAPIDAPDASSPGERPPCPGEVLQAYSRLSDALGQFLQSVPRMGMSLTAVRHGDQGLEIWLESQLDAQSVHNLVASFLRDMNHATPGLQLALRQRVTQ